MALDEEERVGGRLGAEQQRSRQRYSTSGWVEGQTQPSQPPGSHHQSSVLGTQEGWVASAGWSIPQGPAEAEGKPCPAPTPALPHCPGIRMVSTPSIPPEWHPLAAEAARILGTGFSSPTSLTAEGTAGLAGAPCPRAPARFHPACISGGFPVHPVPGACGIMQRPCWGHSPAAPHSTSTLPAACTLSPTLPSPRPKQRKKGGKEIKN